MPQTLEQLDEHEALTPSWSNAAGVREKVGTWRRSSRQQPDAMLHRVGRAAKRAMHIHHASRPGAAR